MKLLLRGSGFFETALLLNLYEYQTMTRTPTQSTRKMCLHARVTSDTITMFDVAKVRFEFSQISYTTDTKRVRIQTRAK